MSLFDFIPFVTVQFLKFFIGVLFLALAFLVIFLALYFCNRFVTWFWRVFE